MMNPDTATDKSRSRIHASTFHERTVAGELLLEASELCESEMFIERIDKPIPGVRPPMVIHLS